MCASCSRNNFKQRYRFANKSEDNRTNYPMIQRMIKIREDFEKFNDEFIEFSR